MKVLHVIDTLKSGGAEQVAVDISILLSRQKGVEVDFLCLLGPSILDDELRKNNVSIIYLYRKNKYSTLSLLRLFSILNQYDLVHVHSRHILRYIGLTFTPFFKRKYKVVFHDHYGNIDMDKGISPYLKYCIKKTDLYIGVSASLVEWAKSNKLNNKTELLGNIIRKNESHKQLASCGDIIVIGNFRRQKNYSFLCHLIKDLPNNITVDLYGNIVDKDYYNEMLKLICDLKITNKLKIFTNEHNVVSVLNNYKVALHCSKSETGPLVAIEYMSQSLPFVTYDTGEVIKLIKSVDNFFTLNHFNKTIWKDKLLELLNDEKLRIHKGKILYEIYEDNFSEETYINKCIELYRRLVKF